MIAVGGTEHMKGEINNCVAAAEEAARLVLEVFFGSRVELKGRLWELEPQGDGKGLVTFKSLGFEAVQCSGDMIIQLPMLLDKLLWYPVCGTTIRFQIMGTWHEVLFRKPPENRPDCTHEFELRVNDLTNPGKPIVITGTSYLDRSKL
jgi:hypothetical protein